MGKRPKSKKRKIIPRPPQYDEVYLQGLAWLDPLAGKDIQSANGKLIISSEMWKSKSRFDPEGIDDDIS